MKELSDLFQKGRKTVTDIARGNVGILRRERILSCRKDGTGRERKLKIWEMSSIW